MRTVSKNTIIAAAFLYLILLYYYFTMPNSIGIDEINTYKIILVCYFPFSIYVLYSINKGINLFEPAIYFIGLYYLIFFIQPLQDIKHGTMIYAQGCLRSMMIMLLGVFFFYIGYYNRKGNQFQFAKKLSYTEEINPAYSSIIFTLAFIIWIISFAMSMIYFIGSGYSLAYIFSIGMTGEANIRESSGLMIFFTFKSCMTASWLYINIFGKNRALKIGLLIITALLLMSLGGRTSLFEFLLVPIFYYYISKKRNPRILTLVILSLFALIISVVLQQVRYSVRLGKGFVAPEFSIDTFLSPFNHELTIYHTLYAVVEAIPAKMSYLFGSGMIIYTLIMFIPRGIWPGKPNPPIYDVVGKAMGQLYVDGGAAYPNIGEYYVEFGILGVIVFMLIFGVFWRNLDSLRIHSKDRSHGIVLYCSTAPLILQFVTRGYTPSNLPQLLLTMLPVFIIHSLLGKKTVYEQNS